MKHRKSGTTASLRFLLTALTLFVPASVGLSQTSADSAQLLSLIKAAPKLQMQRSELVLNPAQLLTSDSVNRQVSFVSVDPNGDVYILQRGVNSPIIVTDRTGKILRSWGEGLFKIPHTIRVDPSGNVWTVDADSSMIYKFNREGKVLLAVAVGGQSAPPPLRNTPCVGVPSTQGQFAGVTDIAFGKNEHFYVTDGYSNNRVLEYDSRGQKVREWGTRGTGPGEFDLPHSIAISDKGELYIADRENGRVQHFTVDGKYLGEWKYGGRLFGLTFGEKTDLFVVVRPKETPTCEEGWLLKIDSKTGKILGAIESPVHSIAFSKDGALFTGTNDGRVIVFRPVK